MLFAVSFFVNAVANFALGLALSAILGPAEFGRYATAQLAALTLAVGMLDWLRLSTLRFSGDDANRVVIASSLEAGYLALTLTLYALAAAAAALGFTFGLGAGLALLTPLLAVAAHRLDYMAARFRARDEARRFAGIYGLRQLLYFTAVIATALITRNALYTVAALAASNLLAAVAFSIPARVEGAALKRAAPQRIREFLVYAKPIVFSLVFYQFVFLINRQVALSHLGVEATGKLSLASDVGLRLFGVANTLPELMLFQYVLKLDRTEGRAAAERQQSRNISLALGLLGPLAAGYATMAPTLEALIAPPAYRGAFASLSAELAPGYLGLFMIMTAISPLYQLKQSTWRLTAAALVALAVDIGLVGFGGFAESLDGLAEATSISLLCGMAATAALVLSVSPVRPRALDLAVIAASTACVVALARPLNAWSHPLLAASAAAGIGALVLGGAYFAFDVGGIRTFLMERARASGAASATGRA